MEPEKEVNILFENIQKELSDIKLLYASLLRNVIANEKNNHPAKLPNTYTLDQVAQILHITKKGVRKKIERGDMNYIPGRVPLITEKQLYDYLKRLQPKLSKNDLV